ncbi:hypothetical protein Taro_056819, partial [Colocasia esculenta]|nr:hypothetical protein [Colocasia esculenta]
IWCVEHDRAPVLGGVAVGGVCLQHQVRVSLHLLILKYQGQGQSTPSPHTVVDPVLEDVVSL